MSVQPAARAVRVQDLRKSFKEVQVLRGVEFEVAPGSVFALLGSNGAGTAATKLLRSQSSLGVLKPPNPARPAVVGGSPLVGRGHASHATLRVVTSEVTPATQATKAGNSGPANAVGVG